MRKSVRYTISFTPSLHSSLPHPSLKSPTGDRIIVVVQKQRNFGEGAGPGGMGAASATNKVRRGDIRHAIVVRTAKKLQRKDGHVIRFDDNACVLINKTGEPVGTRVMGEWTLILLALGKRGREAKDVGLVLTVVIGVVGQELRDKQWSKILSLAPMHV